VSGPFETERQAADTARHIYDSPPGTGAWGDGNHRLMEDACTAASVELGAHDHRILLWLAGWEPSTCAVIAGLITRARRPELEEARAVLLAPPVSLDKDQAATVIAALDDASEGIRERAAYCPACWAHPAALCNEDADRLCRAEAYHHLAARLREVPR
jgi:hypothetical protein